MYIKEEKKMEKGIKVKLAGALMFFALLIAISIGIFYPLKNSSAATYKKDGVGVSLYGYYAGKAYWSMNQDQYFNSLSQYPSKNTFDVLFQSIRLFSKISYGPKTFYDEPLATVFFEADLTNNYNGISSYYGSNGWDILGYTPAPAGFNHDFNTFGLKQAYLRFMTPAGAFLFGRMPVYLGLGIAMNTNADAVGDYYPINGNWSIFGGVLFGNETYAGTSGYGYTASGAVYPQDNPDYTHMQMGTMPIAALTLGNPIDNITGSAWISEAHLNQWGAYMQPALTGYEEGVGEAVSTLTAPATTVSQNPEYPTLNITFGGLSATYSNNGTVISGELDYFDGSVVPSSGLASEAVTPLSSVATVYNQNGTPNVNLPSSVITPLPVYSAGGKDKINSWDIYLTAQTLLNTPYFPLTVGGKFGAGSPISAGHYDFTYYSQLENNSTFFGDVIDGYQAIQVNAPGLAYMYGPLPMSTDLANRDILMGYIKENLSKGNTLRESVIYARWAKTNLSINGTNYQMFGGHTIGTELDLNFTHKFSKTMRLKMWASTVITGNGLDSFSYPLQSVGETNPAPTSVPPYSYHKNIYALGSAFVWAF